MDTHCIKCNEVITKENEMRDNYHCVSLLCKNCIQEISFEIRDKKYNLED